MNEALFLTVVQNLPMVIGFAIFAITLPTLAYLAVTGPVLRSVRRAEQSGDELLEILREQQARWEALREEHQVLLKEMKRERYERSQLERVMLESLIIKENGQQQQPPAVRSALEPLRPRPWWRRVFRG
jgi:hypothetical protein